MQMIEILLPLRDNDGRDFPPEDYAAVRAELVARFGGLTAFTRSPAVGLWADGGTMSRDDIVIFEVMADALDRDWWRNYRAELEARFRQDRIVVRARPVELL
jgi:hypothetical protein